jgi:hypothetical protein
MLAILAGSANGGSAWGCTPQVGEHAMIVKSLLALAAVVIARGIMTPPSRLTRFVGRPAPGHWS